MRHASGADAESRSTALADCRGCPSSPRNVPASHLERPHVEEASRRRDADPSPTEATVGIRRTSADGTVTDVQTGARGLPAIVAHGHTWTVAIVVAGFVAALIAIVMVVRELRPDPAPRDTRSLEGTSQVAPKGAGVRTHCDEEHDDQHRSDARDREAQ